MDMQAAIRAVTERREVPGAHLPERPTLSMVPSLALTIRPVSVDMTQRPVGARAAAGTANAITRPTDLVTFGP